ncbi:hypothetical protein HPP92_009008 [Vanilla planifolia]|uniref:F-box domain-containing protein n=1 Tax=Vanilla planifolia TaxID=51239 RepID=A0A835RAP6_VANPL|nr:hypothetical protein HPP92_009008 [Vanilla planifolia]
MTARMRRGQAERLSQFRDLLYVLSGVPPPFSDQVLENVLENVLCFRTSRHDRNAASLVCRSWYHAEAQTRHELFVGNCYAVSPARTVDRFRSIRALILKGKPRFADFNLVPLGWGACFTPLVLPWPLIPGSSEVCLKRMTVSDDDLERLARSFPSFRELNLICWVMGSPPKALPPSLRTAGTQSIRFNETLTNFC